MAPKRRRPSVTASSENIRTKRKKYSLESAKLPDLTTDGIVLVTGAGDVGQLGLGADVLEKCRPAVVDIKDEIVDMCAGGMHTVCLTKMGKILTFGCNDEGVLGRITENDSDSEFVSGAVDLPGKVIQITAGDSHSAALLDDGRVYAWGTFRDSHGNMGLTVNGNERLPFLILPDVHVVKIASGCDHLVMLSNVGQIYTCGCAEHGQLGRVPRRSSNRDDSRGGIGKIQLAKLLQPALITLKVSLKIHFNDIWAGHYCTFAKTVEKDQIYVFGLNNYGQIGLDNLEPPTYSPTLSKKFSQYKWSKIACGQHHAIALSTEGKVYSIGRKEYGRLGLGTITEDMLNLTLIPTLQDKRVEDIACGTSTSYAVTADGEFYAWGMSGDQLGMGNIEEDSLVPTLVKSKQLLERKVFRVSSGGQHTVLLATVQNNNKEETNNDTNKME